MERKPPSQKGSFPQARSSLCKRTAQIIETNEEDIDFYQFLCDNDIPFIIVMTKCDKLNQSEKAKIFKNLTNSFENFDKTKVTLASIKDPNKLLNVKKAIASFIE